MTVELRELETINRLELLSRIRDAKKRYVRPQIENCVLHRNESFVESDLKRVDFERCVFPETSFLGVNLEGARFDSCRFDQVNFRDSNLLGAVFKDCDPLDVEFDQADLGGARFEKCSLHRVDFSGADLRKTRLSRYGFRERESARPDKEAIRQERAQKWSEAAEVYRLLKGNFVSLADHEGASWASFKEMQMRRRSEGGLFRLAAEWTWGYGERPARPLLFAIGVVIGCATAYWGICSICAEGIDGAETFWDYLLFSGASFVTMSVDGMTATARWAQALSTAEATWGVIVLAMFTFAIGQRISSR